MAINHEGERIGIDRTPGRPRNFDPAFDLLYAVDRLGRRGDPLVFLLFDWLMLREDGKPLPGVVMVWDEDVRSRIACTIHDRGDRGPGSGILLLDARSEGLRNFRTSEAVYAWRGAPGRPECYPMPPDGAAAP